MSMDGISSKIMIHRATDFSRDATNVQRQGAQISQAAEEQVKTQAQIETHDVVDVYKAVEDRIRREKEKEKKKKEEPMVYVPMEEAAPEEGEAPPKRALPVQNGAPGHILDIHI